MTNQFPRKVSLTISSDTQAIDLSALRIKFRVNQSDIQSPNNAIITVFNLSDETSLKIQKEFTKVSLQAGYEDGPYGIIFEGTVRNYGRGNSIHAQPIRVGRVSPTEKYLEINAGEGDDPYNFATIKQTLGAGTTQEDTVRALAAKLGVTYDPEPFNFGANVTNIRGQVIYGMARDGLRNAVLPNGARWSVQNGKLVIIPNNAYLPGEVVELNSKTGMIGIPEQTPDGIKIVCLLNPKIQIGTSVKVNNADVAAASFGPEFADFNQPPPKSADGTYRVLVAEYQGDTRGEDWYTNLTCISVDPSVGGTGGVQPYGGG